MFPDRSSHPDHRAVDPEARTGANGDLDVPWLLPWAGERLDQLGGTTRTGQRASSISSLVIVLRLRMPGCPRR